MYEFIIYFKYLKKNYIKITKTIVLEKCKTLILKLRSCERRYYGFGELVKPEDDIDKIIDTMGDDLIRTTSESLNKIREEVKKSRPNKDDVDYEAKIEAYKNLLDCTTNLINQLTKVFGESLTNYRLSIEKLWDDIKGQSDLNETNNIFVKFEEDSQNIFINALQKHLAPYLDAIESKIV